MTMKKVALPAFPIEGGCQCGQVRYSLTRAPRMFYLCHCTECQTHTSSAFGESLRVDPDAVEVSGTLKTTERMGKSGVVRFGDFCPECGVRIFHRSADDPDRLNIKAGTLDDTSWLVPAGHIWVRSKQPFVRIDADELQYSEEPGDGEAAIAARWREMTQA